MQIELSDNITLEFELDSYEAGESQSGDCPEVPECFDFSYTIKIEYIDYLDDLEELRGELKKVIEGDDIQGLMETEYKKQNPPEPNEPY